MKYCVIVVRDRTADVFGAPTFHASVGGAIRGFSDEVNRKDANNMFNRHPEDFDLFMLGTYDDATASFECALPKQIAIGKDVFIKE